MTFARCTALAFSPSSARMTVRFTARTRSSSISPEDRPSPGTIPVQPAQTVSANNDDGFQLSSSIVGAIVLALLAGLMAGYAVHDVRNVGKTASA